MGHHGRRNRAMLAILTRTKVQDERVSCARGVEVGGQAAAALIAEVVPQGRKLAGVLPCPAGKQGSGSA